jgi:hypothetical protein
VGAVTSPLVPAAESLRDSSPGQTPSGNLSGRALSGQCRTEPFPSPIRFCVVCGGELPAAKGRGRPRRFCASCGSRSEAAKRWRRDHPELVASYNAARRRLSVRRVAAEVRRERVRELWQAGLSSGAIARILDVPRSTVTGDFSVLRRRGVTPPPVVVTLDRRVVRR